ncbi:polysaccharide deacetylase family protein [Gallaecimonas sp. GXIMD4217]|uniref:polysaccharide deacetylase family protein n=1 Tax=Gallaecimonas sp. GXIMD4217 TaxID=3131927 RepID=UPI00311AEF74
MKALLVALLAALAFTAHADIARTLAVTIDDLPVVRGQDLARAQAITHGLLTKLQAAKAPAIGFVNEQKLGEPEPDPARVALLKAWLDAGMDLGNHGYSHKSFYKTPLAEFQQELLKGERVLKELLAAQGRKPAFFRHPYLNTGPDADTRAQFEAFLAEHGYRVAPVTFDNDEWIYALAYDKALVAGDKVKAEKVAEDYLRYMAENTAFFEALSVKLLGREPAQILLLHANALNADYLAPLLALYRDRGYGFVSLEQALADPAYRQQDHFISPWGISWLERWWHDRHGKRLRTPDAAPWVAELAGIN